MNHRWLRRRGMRIFLLLSVNGVVLLLLAGAADENTFVAQLEATSPTIEAVNMGVPGYGVDQMYLWYKREGQKLDADLLLMAFIADDFRRMKLTAFQARYPKPQLVQNGNAIEVSNVPVPEWGAPEAGGWLEEFPNKSGLMVIGRAVLEMRVLRYDPLPVAEHIFAELNTLSRQKGQQFALVYLPSSVDMESESAIDLAIRVREVAACNRIPFFNLTPALSAVSARGVTVFDRDGRRYSEAGYRAIAMALMDTLRAESPEVTAPAR